MASRWAWPLALGASLMLAVGTALAVVSVRNEREYERLVLAGDAALGAADLSAAIEAYHRRHHPARPIRWPPT